MSVTVAPYGTWASPITPELIAATGNRVRSPESVAPADEGICWMEQPSADGRTTLLYRGADGSVTELTPAPLSCQSKVSEHGGCCYTVAGHVTFFANGADQRLYRREPDGRTWALTPELGDVRYSEPIADAKRQLLYCVMEDHRPDGDAETTLVAVPMAGGSPVTIVSGHDFFGSARLSPDGSRLAWVCWDHPSMPWDSTALWVGELGEDGSLVNSRQVAGGEHESALFPRWSPQGVLHFLSDRSGYTNLYRLDDAGPTALGPDGADTAEGLPLPLFNGGYDFVPDGRIFFMVVKDGTDSLHLLGPDGTKEIATPFTYIPEVRVAGDRALLVAAGPEQLRTVALVSPDGETEIIQPTPAGTDLDRGFTSWPETVSFPSDGFTVQGFLYPPANPGFEGPPGELPPLIVQAHGGPIGCTHPVRGLDIQMFTSRGFAVLDVNYRGSRGYGRAYREALYGRWGEADVDDCIAGARYVTEKGLADPARIMIRGGSAGGYTVLASLAFRDFYLAGISRFGLSNLELFMRPGGTHKFESRANIYLVGPYPEAAELYRARSPVYHAEQFTVPVLLLQGSADPVVPAEQARGMAQRLQELGKPVTVVEFEGEGHGFRRAENLARAYHAELDFTDSVFHLNAKE
jgi:dipeptidyl aminopeptidase/acylaminoacyl peptidase